MLIMDYLTFNARKYSDYEAIVNIGSNNQRTSISWGEFNFVSNQVANFLKCKSIKKGDKVGILLHNSMVWLPIYFGILKAGAVAVLLNYNNSIEEIEYYIEYADCRVVFVSRQDKSYSFLSQKDILICGFDSIKEFYIILEKQSGTFEVNTVSSTDIATIYFSSGTTGRAKAILISHESLVSAAQTELSHHNQCLDDRFLCLQPLYHTGAKIHWFGSLLVGGSIVLFSPASPQRILNVIEQEKITISFLLVPQIKDILDAIDIGDIELEKYDFTRWRLMHSGAQYVPKSLIERWRNKFPWQLYDTNYGLTEATGPGCIHLGVNNMHKIGSIGKPDFRWTVDIVDNGKTVSSGNVGEIILKGPGTMIGYYKDEKSTNEVMIDGWLYTGDMAYMDEDGFIYVVDRKKDVIISGGENIYPIEIENHIRKLAVVKDVSVIGAPNSRMGEIPVAIIEMKEGAICTTKQLVDHCSQLPPYKRPYKFIFKAVIKNSLGKPNKKEMKRCYLK